MLGICITTYNRERQLLALLNNLNGLITKYPDKIRVIVHNDGGSSEIIESFTLPNNVTFVSTKNEGVFLSKYRTIQMARAAGCDWYIHLDDDDYLDHSTVVRILSIMDDPKYSKIHLIQANTTRVVEKPFRGGKGYQYSLKFEPTDKKIVLGMNGQAVRFSDEICARLDEYENSDIANWRIEKDSWGEDILIPGYLTQNLSDEDMMVIDDVLCIQNYFDGEYHLVTDPNVLHFSRSYVKHYVRHIKRI